MFGVFINLLDMLEAIESKEAYETRTNSRYADCIRVVRREVKDDFWRSSIIDMIPYGQPDDIYEAIMEVVKDSTDDFWTHHNVEHILRKYKNFKK